MPERTEISGLLFVDGADGETKTYGYKASHEEPRRDEAGMLVFGWSATIDGVDNQPWPRTAIFRSPGDLIDPAFLKKRIEVELERHLKEMG